MIYLLSSVLLFVGGVLFWSRKDRDKDRDKDIDRDVLG